MPLTVDVITTDKGFVALKDAWDALVAAQDESNIFVEHDWLYTCWRHFGREEDLFIVTVRQGGLLKAIAPFMKVRRFGFIGLEFIGAAFSDFEGVILAPGDEASVFQVLFDFIFSGKHAHFCRVRRIKENTATKRFFGIGIKEGRARVIVNVQPHKERAPYLDLGQGWSELIKGLRTKFLSDTDRLERKLGREQGFRIEQVPGIDGSFSDLLGRIPLMCGNNKERGGLLDQPRIAFLNDVAVKFRDKGWMDVKALFIKDKIAAVQMGFIYRDNYYYYLPAFDEAFRQYGVGRILLKNLIGTSFERGLKIFDFMLGEEKYKLEWNPHFMPLYFCHIAPRTLSGMVAFFLFDKLFPWIRKQQGRSW